VIGRIIPAANRWLPGQLLAVVGQGGTTVSSLPRALVISVAYLAIFGALATYTFVRRDVTA
jgi:hypothetical protein